MTRQPSSVHFCPADNGNPEYAVAKGTARWDGSYGLVHDTNRVAPYQWSSTAISAKRNIRNYKDATLKIAFFEQMPTSNYYSSWGYWYNSWGRRDMRHYNGHNVSFMDGVVRRYADPFNTIDSRWWLSTPGDWRYGSGKPTETTLFLNVEDEGSWWFRWWNQVSVPGGGGFEY